MPTVSPLCCEINTASKRAVEAMERVLSAMIHFQPHRWTVIDQGNHTLYIRNMEFPDPHIHPPQVSHTHTAILLHGRGSDGPEFAEEIFSSMTSRNQNMASCLPTWRWVFPTSRSRWSTTFQEEECSWFDAYSLTDIHARQDLQVDGLRESVPYVLDILENEIRLLAGRSNHVYFGGISQGMATALWTLFCATRRIHGPLGGLLGLGGWLPFAQQVEDLEEISNSSRTGEWPQPRMQHHQVLSFFHDTIFSHEKSQVNEMDDMSILSTPVFLSHGTDDAWVSVELGRQASRISRRIMGHVVWNEFTGAEGDGHWIKEPEGFDCILQFLEQRSSQVRTRGNY